MVLRRKCLRRGRVTWAELTEPEVRFRAVVSVKGLWEGKYMLLRGSLLPH